MQSTVAIINVVCFYIIGLPIGLVLGYVTNLQVKVTPSRPFHLFSNSVPGHYLRESGHFSQH